VALIGSEIGEYTEQLTQLTLVISDDRFGSLADLFTNSNLMSGFGWKAVIREPIFERPKPNVRFSRKRTLRLAEYYENEGPLTARSRHSRALQLLLIVKPEPTASLMHRLRPYMSGVEQISA
jgi:hypothetical protein